MPFLFLGRADLYWFNGILREAFIERLTSLRALGPRVRSRASQRAFKQAQTHGRAEYQAQVKRLRDLRAQHIDKPQENL